MTNDELQAHIAAIEKAMPEIEESVDDKAWGKPSPYSILIGDVKVKYRIKPKPLECWVSFHDGGVWNVFDEKPTKIESDAVLVRMREVTDEV